MMTLKNLVFALLVFALASCQSKKADLATSTPNVIVILTDDLGYGDVSCYGATEISTPNIDALAANGVRFTQGYCSSATCTPSRYALLTGKYPWKNDRARVLAGDAPLIMQPGMQTLPSVLKTAGYSTAVVGKWHLGLGNGTVDWNERIEAGPNDVGFDYSYILAATQDRVPTVILENQKVDGLSANDPIQVSYKHNFADLPTGKKNPELLKLHPSHGHDMSIHNGISRIGFQTGGKDAMWVDEDLADVFTSKAKTYINEHKDAPFFLYFTLHQPHVPRTPHSRFVGKSGMGARGDAILEADWCVGEISKELKRLGLEKNTLIVFSSDNGPVLDDGYKDEAFELAGKHDPAGGLRSGKYSLYDGGTRVPFIMSWDGTIAPKVSNALVTQIDLLASVAKLVEAPLTEDCDSEDILEAFLGQSEEGRESVVLEACGNTLVRNREWMYIPSYSGPKIINQWVRNETGNSTEAMLFNVSDKAQKHNVAAENPEVVVAMQAELERLMGDYYNPGNNSNWDQPHFRANKNIKKSE